LIDVPGTAWTLVPGEIVAHYRVISPIASGGMGQVYLAEDVRLGRKLALKVLEPRADPDDARTSRFEREARAISALNHPNIITIYDTGEVRGQRFIATEFIDGFTLRSLLGRGRIELRRALAIAMQMAEGLAVAHAAGVVHRDLKPENVMVRADGQVKVLDFGLAKVTQREMRPGSLILTQEGMVFGTPEFMSPEQARGQSLDARSDIYSLGCILYEMLTGKLPFDASQPMDYLALQIRGTPISLSQRIPGLSFPPGLEPVVMKTLEKDPANRYPSAADFAMALRGCLGELVSEDAIRSVPHSEESQRFIAEGQQAAHAASPAPHGTSSKPAAQPAQPSGRPPAASALRAEAPGEVSVQGAQSLSQSPVLWAALGAGVMLVVGGAVALAVLLLR
jgi:serine/threonine protein kinase